MSDKSCATCGFRSLNPQQCPVINYQYLDKEDEVCPYWVDQVMKCEYCGQVVFNYAILETSDGSWKCLCEQCSGLSGSCRMCSKSTTCDFETNPSSIPKAVQKQIRQGNMITVMTVKSDERIAETCAKNCDCFDRENNICLRENGTCGNYNDIF